MLTSVVVLRTVSEDIPEAVPPPFFFQRLASSPRARASSHRPQFMPSTTTGTTIHQLIHLAPTLTSIHGLGPTTQRQRPLYETR